MHHEIGNKDPELKRKKKEALKVSSKEVNNVEKGMAIASFHCLQNVVLRSSKLVS